MQQFVNNNLSYGRGYVYNIQYHIVWCTKYRKPVLVNETEQSLKESLQQTAETLKINIVEMECMPDHIHLLVECSPQHFIPDMVKVLKGNSATSKLAFDGSGALKRDETNRALATFVSGKQYNCDLSASYNIGARYFVRELLKPLPAMVRSQLSANVPDAERRIQVTLATLKVLYPELKKLSTQAA